METQLEEALNKHLKNYSSKENNKWIKNYLWNKSKGLFHLTIKKKKIKR